MRRASPLDAAFLGLEAPDHPMHTMAVMVLDPSTVTGGYSFDRLRTFIAGRLAGIPPLRRRVVPAPLGLARPGWVDSDVDIRAHVFRHMVTGATMTDLASYAARLAVTPLDRSKPLWAMHVVEGLADGRIAVVAKVHHSLMDGVAGMAFLASMFSLRPDAGPVVGVPDGSRRAVPMVLRTASAIPELVGMPARVGRALLASGRAAVRLRDLAGRGELALPRPPRMRWNGEVGSRRAMALAALPLAELKAVSRATGCTVNDVVMSVLGGASRTYLLEHGELPSAPLVAAVPVSTHGPGEGRRVPRTANAVSLTLCTLGTDIAGPFERLVAVHDGMVRAKLLHEAIGDTTLVDWLAVPNPAVLAITARAYLGLHVVRVAPWLPNVLVSNVPGPTVPLYFGGARLLALYPLGPVYDGVGLNVTVVSSEDTVGFGLVSSPEMMDDLHALAGRLAEELRALRLACGTAAPARRHRGTPREAVRSPG